MAIDPISASAIGSAVSSIASGLFGGGNRSWQQMMSNTAHQREVKDLRAAGLNPILSAGGGSGASTPSGASIDVQDLGGSISSGFAAKVAKQQADIADSKQKQDKLESDSRISNNQANLLFTKENIQNLISTRMVNSAMIQKFGAETAHTMQSIEILKKHPELIASQIYNNQASAGLAGAHSAQSAKTIEKLEAEIDKLRSEKKGLDADLPGREVKGSLYKEFQKESPEGGSFFDTLDNNLRKAQKWFSQ